MAVLVGLGAQVGRLPVGEAGGVAGAAGVRVHGERGAVRLGEVGEQFLAAAVAEGVGPFDDADAGEGELGLGALLVGPLLALALLVGERVVHPVPGSGRLEQPGVGLRVVVVYVDSLKIASRSRSARRQRWSGLAGPYG